MSTCEYNRKKRVLSIQSHVVHGYVGNKGATFPLQVLGFDVDPINSVNFSNHTGYKVFKGQVMKETELLDVFQGLELNGLLQCYSHLLTGYIGNAAVLRQIAEVLRKLRDADPNVIYVCDPVMGDNGHMYVPQELLPIYQNEIVPLANVVTPNQYELELLTEIKINTVEDVWKAIGRLHAKNIDVVVVSSSNLRKDTELCAFLSTLNGPRYTINIPKQEPNATFTGTGDVFAALFLAHSSAVPKDQIHVALEKTVATLQAIIKRTLDEMHSDSVSQRELKLIQSKGDIENPKVILKARPL